MKDFGSAEEVLDFAVGEEEQAHQFYSELAERVSLPGMREVMLQFAQEELGHKAKLLEVKVGKKMVGAEAAVVDLRIGDNLVEIEARPEIAYQDALIIAMKKEKAAYAMYSKLASAMSDDWLRDLFLGIAQEEANHKLRFEVVYDEQVMREN